MRFLTRIHPLHSPRASPQVCSQWAKGLAHRQGGGGLRVGLHGMQERSGAGARKSSLLPACKKKAVCHTLDRDRGEINSPPVRPTLSLVSHPRPTMGRYGDIDAYPSGTPKARAPATTSGGAPGATRRSRPRPLTIGDDEGTAQPAAPAPTFSVSACAGVGPVASPPPASGEAACLASPALVPALAARSAATYGSAAAPTTRTPLLRGPSLALPSPAPACTPSLAGVHRRFRW